MHGPAQDGAPFGFVNACRDANVPTLHRYRMRLREAHQSQNYRPWIDGLPYVLAGGGHFDPFYQNLIQHRLPEWLCTLVDEWHPTFPDNHYRGLRMQRFPLPQNFGSAILAPHFDRFSVAHGLSLGKDGLMDFHEASQD
jgi:hypothetical protein